MFSLFCYNAYSTIIKTTSSMMNPRLLTPFQSFGLLPSDGWKCCNQFMVCGVIYDCQCITGILGKPMHSNYFRKGLLSHSCTLLSYPGGLECLRRRLAQLGRRVSLRNRGGEIVRRVCLSLMKITLCILNRLWKHTLSHW